VIAAVGGYRHCFEQPGQSARIDDQSGHPRRSVWPASRICDEYVRRARACY
jgi:hypothetical protein